jgi:hypothetical protein
VLITFPPDPRKRPTAAAIVKKFKDKGIDPKATCSTPMRPFSGRRYAGRHHRSTGRRRHARRHRDTVLGPSLTTSMATSRRAAGRCIAGQRRQLRRSTARRGGVERVFRARRSTIVMRRRPIVTTSEFGTIRYARRWALSQSSPAAETFRVARSQPVRRAGEEGNAGENQQSTHRLFDC